MQTALAALALSAAVLGLLYSNLTAVSAAARGSTDRRPRQTPWPVLVWLAALVVAGFLATLSSRPPFSPGLTLGWGFLIGGVVALYAAIESQRSVGRAQWLARGVGLLAAAVFGVSLILLVFRGYPNEALMGYGLAAILAGALWRSCVRPWRAPQAAEDPPAASDLGMELFALGAVALAVGARLGIEHFPRGATEGLGGGYWALPALLAAVAALAAIFPAQLALGTSDRSREWHALVPGWIATAVAVILAFLLASKLAGSSGTALAFLVGSLGFALAGWLALEAAGPAAEPARPTTEAFGIALLSLAVAALSFKLLHGYGQVLALSGGVALLMLLALGRARASDGLAGPLLTGGFVVLLLLALYRLFMEKNGAGHPLDFQEHYDYFGLALGAAAGFGLLAYGRRARQIAEGAPDRTAALSALMTRAAVLGLATVLAPLALLVVWGIGCLGGFLVGLVVAELSWMLLTAWVAGEERTSALAAAPHVYLVGMALVAVQFTPVVVGMGTPARLWKLVVVVVVVVAAVVWTVVPPLLRRARQPQGGGGVG